MGKTIFDIIMELEDTSSRNEKIKILRHHLSNEVLIRVLYLALNPMIRFWVKQLPEYTPEKSRDPHTNFYKVLGDLQEQICGRQKTGHDALNYIKEVLETVSIDQAMVLERVIQKDLKCGVKAATVNKVWKNLIPEYPCMKASKLSDKVLNNIEFPCYAQIKSDGMRINIHVAPDKETVSYFSRNGKPVFCNNEQLDADAISIASSMTLIAGMYVLDGEMVAVDPKTEELLPRKESNGICNKAIRGTISEDEKETLRIVLWDYIPFPEFQEGKWNCSYRARLTSLGSSFENDTGRISLVKTSIVSNPEEATKLSKEYINKGYEGIIIKEPNSIWKDKRSKKHIKFKQVKDVDVLCTGTKEGTGAFEGMIGSLQCESADGVKFSVGTGLSVEDRARAPEEYIGKIIEVQYNDIIGKKKEGSEKSLFLPVFVCVRHDKDSPQTLLD